MRSLSRPRLASLDVFSSCLLATLGLAQTGCGSVVEEDDGEGGASATTSGSPSATSSKATSGVATNGTNATSVVGTSVVASSSTGAGNVPCANPMPLVVDGVDTGFDVCQSGNYRRRAVESCPIGMPNPADCCGGCQPGEVCNDSGEVACFCQPACRGDADCGPNELCFCGTGGGQCVQASCHLGSECAAGQECTSWDPTNGCLYVGFACTTAADTCAGDLDCAGSPTPLCSVQPDGHRQCSPGGCAIGRPFLVEGEVRRAEVVARADWTTPCTLPSLDGLAADLRIELAEAWEHVATMEHASVAAFARFALQLLALGAPSDLVSRTQRAMSDEIAHAKLAFALASAYRATPVGPAPLAIDGALDAASDVVSIIRLVVREGCVGETIAALEAAELVDRCVDPAPRWVLDRIADEETQHAELAWLTVRWALDVHGAEVADVIADELAALERELEVSPPEPTADDDRLAEHGVATGGLRARLRHAALRRSVVPCLRALLDAGARVAA